MTAGFSAAMASLQNADQRVPARRAHDLLPREPGVYCWWLPRHPDAATALGFTAEGARLPIYVGAAASLSERVATHLKPQRKGRSEFRWEFAQWACALGTMPWGLVWMLGPSDERRGLWEFFECHITEFMGGCEVSWVTTPDFAEARRVESRAIRNLEPFFNRAGTGPRRLRGETWWRGRVDDCFGRDIDEFHHWCVWAEWAQENVATILRLPDDQALIVEMDDRAEPAPEARVGLVPETSERSEAFFMNREIASLLTVELFADWYANGPQDGLFEPCRASLPSPDQVFGSLTPEDRVVLMSAGVAALGWDDFE